MRQIGSRNKLITINYDLIGELPGTAGDTARQYAHRGEYDPRDLISVLSWVNSRRKRQGLPMVGVPAEHLVESEAQVKREQDRFTRPTEPPLDLSGGYDPLLGGYRIDTAFRR